MPSFGWLTRGEVKTERRLRTLTVALDAVSKTEERSDEAELRRVNGKLALQSDGHSRLGLEMEAEEHFRDAIDLAHKKGASHWSCALL